MNPEAADHNLVVTIVPKGAAEKVLRASQEAGAEGGTIIYGRGAGIHEKRKVMGVPIEPEKEIVLTLVLRSLTQAVLEKIIAAARLDEPGRGISFVLPVAQVAGICHFGECAGIGGEQA